MDRAVFRCLPVMCSDMPFVSDPSLESSQLAADDPELVARLRARDAQAFARLVNEHGGRLLSVARRLLAHEEDARDAVQDAFVSAFRALPTFEGQSRLSTWLHRIVVNAALMKLRQRRRRPECSIEDLLPKFLPDGHQADPPDNWSAEAETRLLRGELQVVVRRAIEELPEAYRTVLVLRDLEGFDTEQTARWLEVGEGVVKTRLHRARQALRTLLDHYFRGGDPK